MKKIYVFPTIKQSEYYPEEAYAEVTVPGFSSVGTEEPIEPEDQW